MNGAKEINLERVPDRSIGGLHVAVIMDGNGRWATRRGLPRPTGHKAGAEAVRRVMTAAPRLGVGVLTLYAFSSDNWRRPGSEVARLMKLFAAALRRELGKCLDNGVRLSVIGRRDRLPGRLPELIAQAELATRHCTKLHLRIAVDYSAREVLSRAARLCVAADGESSHDFNIAVARAQNEPAPVPPVWTVPCAATSGGRPTPRNR